MIRKEIRRSNIASILEKGESLAMVVLSGFFFWCKVWLRTMSALCIPCQEGLAGPWQLVGWHVALWAGGPIRVWNGFSFYFCFLAWATTQVNVSWGRTVCSGRGCPQLSSIPLKGPDGSQQWAVPLFCGESLRRAISTSRTCSAYCEGTDQPQLVPLFSTLTCRCVCFL